MINMNTSMWRNIISRARFAPCKAFEELTKMTQNCEKKAIWYNRKQKNRNILRRNKKANESNEKIKNNLL